MNRTTRSCELLLVLLLAAACGPDAALTSGMGSATSPTAPTASKRGDVLFTRAIRDQLARRGVSVYGGGQTAGRTTVEEKWIAVSPGSQPMTQVMGTDPTTSPERYAVQLSLHTPNIIDVSTQPPLSKPGEDGSCSGSLIDNTAVLTAAHCVIDFVDIGVDPATKEHVFSKVKKYSITARPRRNGNDGTMAAVEPHGRLAVKKSFWEFSNWPGSSLASEDRNYDYAVVRFQTSPIPSIPVASVGDLADPQGNFVVLAHYPLPYFAPQRDFHMFHSEGLIGAVSDVYSGNVYTHNASIEPGSSGAGVFESTVGRLVGVIVSEAPVPPTVPPAPPPPPRGPGDISIKTFPNDVLMLTPGTVANISTWVSARF